MPAARACRQINWYLFEYIGCEKSTDKYHYDFSSGLARGRGVIEPLYFTKRSRYGQ
jgi:hypothetical protein